MTCREPEAHLAICAGWSCSDMLANSAAHRSCGRCCAAVLAAAATSMDVICPRPPCLRAHAVLVIWQRGSGWIQENIGAVSSLDECVREGCRRACAGSIGSGLLCSAGTCPVHRVQIDGKAEAETGREVSPTQGCTCSMHPWNPGPVMQRALSDNRPRACDASPEDVVPTAPARQHRRQRRGVDVQGLQQLTYLRQRSRHALTQCVCCTCSHNVSAVQQP